MAELIVNPATLEELKSIAPSDPDEFIRSLVQVFLDQTNRDLAQFKEAFALDDLKTMGDLAHKMKSGAAQLGAVHFSQCAKSVEQYARAGDTAQAKQWAPVMIEAYAETEHYYQTHGLK